MILRSKSPRLTLMITSAILIAIAPTATAQTTDRTPADILHPCKGNALGKGALCGHYEVFENRATGTGRKISLNIIVLPATAEQPAADPVFYLAGGPGGSATSAAAGLARSWMRRDRDIVMVDQRGTGKSNPLRVRLLGDDSNLQGYLDPIWDVATFRRAQRRLEQVADLSQYTTCVAADDLNEVRQALGYDKINLVGGSYGSRAALIYIRRHPDTVRTAILTGIAPISFKNPLYHAKAAQEGFDTLVAECKADPGYAIYHHLDSELATVLARLRKAPADVTVKHPRTGAAVTVQLDANGFAEALRVLMYYMGGNRRVPLLVHRAHAGDYTPFAEAGIRSNRSLRNYLAMGMLMSVVGSEDIPRIKAGEIDRATANTFLGDARVRQQSAIAQFWPKGKIPADYGKAVHGDMPVLFLSGTHDPVTPPRWGAAAARHFPNGKHLVVPAAHGTSDPRIEAFKRRFLHRGSLGGLDTAFVEQLRLPRLAMPSKRVLR